MHQLRPLRPHLLYVLADVRIVAQILCGAFQHLQCFVVSVSLHRLSSLPQALGLSLLPPLAVRRLSLPAARARHSRARCSTTIAAEVPARSPRAFLPAFSAALRSVFRAGVAEPWQAARRRISFVPPPAAVSPPAPAISAAFALPGSGSTLHLTWRTQPDNRPGLAPLRPLE